MLWILRFEKKINFYNPKEFSGKKDNNDEKKKNNDGIFNILIAFFCMGIVAIIIIVLFLIIKYFKGIKNNQIITNIDNLDNEKLMSDI